MTLIDTIFLVIVNFVWGMNFLAAKWAVADFPPMVVNAIRFAIVTVLLLPFLKPVRGRMKDLFIAAFVLGVLHFGLIFIAMSFAEGVSAMAIVSQLNVPFATILAIVILKEQVGWKRVSGIAVSFLGVLVLGFDPAVFEYVDAVVFMAAAAFVYALSTILMRQLKDVKAVTTQAWVGLFGCVGSVFLSLIFEVGQVEAISTAGSLAWGAVVYSAIMSSIVGHGGLNYLLRKYEVSHIAPYFVLTPLFAIGGGIFILDEVLTDRMMIGGTLTIVGVAIVTLRNSRRGSKELKTVQRVGKKFGEQ
ncbi:hypothetical protein GCM10017044_16760 [Kordiimonas sediminis]|uniref:EamA domain-containing protein n=1 Tax=Kordiimonas sediminis TaxID=1735581 RepID=A0A919E646_9PROT|nr:DMT family transporter [Kordiimonas sediminis]GHF23002.1 hypothetical protein GCM10017044_16760 [Kordiimonas sediminis]